MLKAPFRAGAEDAAAGERQATGEGVGAVESLISGEHELLWLCSRLHFGEPCEIKHFSLGSGHLCPFIGPGPTQSRSTDLLRGHAKQGDQVAVRQ